MPILAYAKYMYLVCHFKPHNKHFHDIVGVLYGIKVLFTMHSCRQVHVNSSLYMQWDREYVYKYYIQLCVHTCTCTSTSA